MKQKKNCFTLKSLGVKTSHVNKWPLILSKTFCRVKYFFPLLHLMNNFSFHVYLNWKSLYKIRVGLKYLIPLSIFRPAKIISQQQDATGIFLVCISVVPSTSNRRPAFLTIIVSSNLDGGVNLQIFHYVKKKCIQTIFLPDLTFHIHES